MSEHDPHGGDSPPIDISGTLDQVGGDEDFLQEILDLYQEDFNDQFRRLELAVSGEEFNAIREIGHSLKGSSSNLGMPFLTEVSHAIEQAGEERHTDRIRALIGDLDREFRRLVAWLAEG